MLNVSTVQGISIHTLIYSNNHQQNGDRFPYPFLLVQKVKILSVGCLNLSVGVFLNIGTHHIAPWRLPKNRNPHITVPLLFFLFFPNFPIDTCAPPDVTAQLEAKRGKGGSPGVFPKLGVS